MKQQIISALVICAVLAGCASAGKGASTSDALIDTDWLLVEVRKGDILTSLDREKLETEGRGGYFSLRFNAVDGENHLSGRAAPNQYSAPVSWGARHTLTVGLVVSTKMAALQEPEGITEHEFLDAISHAKSWNLAPDGRLELATEGGSSATLIFSPHTTAEETTAEENGQIKKAP